MTVQEFIDRSIENGKFCFDAEHLPSMSPHKEGFKLIGMGFYTEGCGFFCREPDDIAYICRALFPKVEAIAHNIKYDLHCVRSVGIGSYEYPAKPVDTMIAVNLLDDNRRPNQLGLKAIMRDWFGVDMSTYEEAIKSGPRSKRFEAYGMDDVLREYQLWEHCKPRLEKEGLLKYFKKVVSLATLVFADMEQVGIGWDITRARTLLRGYGEIARNTEKEVFQEIGELNLNSGDQLAKRLFQELGYPTTGLEMTKSGKRVAVDAKAMDTLAERLPICDKIRTYRTAKKMNGTYVEPCTRMALEDPHQRIHPTYWLVSTTGRTRCEKPNFQNIPKWVMKRLAFKKLSIRANVIPAPGRKLLIFDYSQIELRLIAHITQDPVFLAAYRKWNCEVCGGSGEHDVILHSCPKCEVEEDEKEGFWHGEDIHQKTTDMVPALGGNRQNGKRANFALVYYATAYKMAYEYPELSRGKWQEVIDDYFDVYQHVRAWHVRMEHALRESGVCSDIFGRKRRLSKQEIARSPKHALNQFINFGPQSGAVGMILLSMNHFRQRAIEDGTWLDTVFPTNMVHDEFILEVEEGHEDYAIELLRDCTENCVKLRVPIRSDIKVVDRWQEPDDE